ncbi:MAG: phosphatase PAP2 family protein [Saprospiraceae bacterium]|nr:phosphatase PAP2 family protein [Saprospiraceae bacterium]MDZ4705573.1 phosphatase PAP2 family protein [Saprospiraceae bacterium]
MPESNYRTEIDYKIILENRWFFGSAGLFFLVGGFLLMQINTGDDIFFFSERRSAFGDVFFRWFTKMGEAWIYVVVLFYFLFQRYRQAIAIPMIGLMVTCIAFAFKTFFGQDRPLAFLTKQGLFDLVHPVAGVELNGGATSFPSGHTTSAFALFTFVALCLPYKRTVAVVLFAFAFLTGISRIYLVQHFLKDVYAGAILGLFIGMALYVVQERWDTTRRPWLDRSLRGGDRVT